MVFKKTKLRVEKENCIPTRRKGKVEVDELSHIKEAKKSYSSEGEHGEGGNGGSKREKHICLDRYRYITHPIWKSKRE